MTDYFYDEDGDMIGDSSDYGEMRYKKGFQAALKAIQELEEMQEEKDSEFACKLGCCPDDDLVTRNSFRAELLTQIKLLKT